MVADHPGCSRLELHRPTTFPGGKTWLYDDQSLQHKVGGQVRGRGPDAERSAGCVWGPLIGGPQCRLSILSKGYISPVLVFQKCSCRF